MGDFMMNRPSVESAAASGPARAGEGVGGAATTGITGAEGGAVTIGTDPEAMAYPLAFPAFTGWEFPRRTRIFTPCCSISNSVISFTARRSSNSWISSRFQTRPGPGSLRVEFLPGIRLLLHNSRHGIRDRGHGIRES